MLHACNGSTGQLVILMVEYESNGLPDEDWSLKAQESRFSYFAIFKVFFLQ